jgi:2'-5' RNA ligase
MHEHIRTFIALELPAEIRGELGRVQRRLITRLATDAVRWTAPGSIHLTVKFLGDVPAESIPALAEALQRACKDASAMRLALGGLGCFPSMKKPSVIWLGVAGETERLRQIFEKIDAATAEFSEHVEDRAFNPHLTLGRVKPNARSRAKSLGGKLAQEQLTATGATGEWMADRVVLFKSELTPKGSIYTPLSVVELRLNNV